MSVSVKVSFRYLVDRNAAKVSFRYLVDRNAAMNEHFEKAELDPAFTEWQYDWKECLLCPLINVFEDEEWKWLNQREEETLRLVEQLKTQIEGSGANYEPILNDECQEVASQIAEEGNESITKSDLGFLRAIQWRTNLSPNFVYPDSINCDGGAQPRNKFAKRERAFALLFLNLH